MLTEMDLGFSGTQKGMTEAQTEAVWSMIAAIALIYPQGKVNAHHGLCIGADWQFHVMCRGWVIPIIGHPPVNKSKVAKFDMSDFAYLWDDKDYLDRNTDIVNCSTSFIGAPGEMEEQLRSGTWSTIRKAKKKGIRGVIVFPDGSTEDFG